MDEQMWTGVRDRVTALAASPQGSKVFGSIGHRFRLEAPLRAWELDALELQIGVRLPDEYRLFLLDVAAGGAGPHYGVHPVSAVQGHWRWEGDGADLTDLDRLAEPFPLEGPDPQAVEALQGECPEEEDFAEDDGFDEAMEAWDERWAALMWKPDRTVGAVLISHLGCALRQWLIVSGPARGQIWADDRADEVDLAPVLDDEGSPLTFSRWYLAWLRQAEGIALAATG